MTCNIVLKPAGSSRLCQLSQMASLWNRSSREIQETRCSKLHMASQQILTAAKHFSEACKSQNIPLVGAALRWIVWNSPLTPVDGVILGASSLAQVDENAAAIAQGPLSRDLVDAVNELWESIKDSEPAK